MNNFKKLLAVVIVVTMLVTAMIPAMAATSYSYEDEAQVLSDLGLMVGDGTNLDLGGKLTREMGAVLLVRLLGAEEDALALTDAEIAAALEDYTDKDDISFWAEAYVAYATDAGYLAGRDDGSLDPQANLLGKDYATMILRAMGYEVDAEGWAIATTLLTEVDGLSVAQAIKFNDKALIRDDAAGITYAALLGETAEAGTLIEALVAAGAVDADAAEEAGLYTKPVAAGVKDITMSELREVVVTFTAPVNATEAKKLANYTIQAKAPTAAALSADGKTVTLTVDPTFATANYASYDVVVKAAVGISADYTKKVVATDVTIPTLVSATPVGPRAIKLTFSENLNLATAYEVMSSLKLDNGTLAISAPAITAFTKTITINTYVDMAETAHTIALSGSLLKDVAGYSVQAASLTFNYVKDSSALTYTVGATTETQVKITFNKAIAVGTLIGNGNAFVAHSYNNRTYPATVETTDNQTFTFKWASTIPLPPGTTTIYVGYDSATGAKIKDQYGIVMEAFNFAVTTTPDFTKPTVTSAEFVDYNKVKVTFSEAVESTTATTAANYVLKDSAGAVISTSVDVPAYAKDSNNANITTQIILTTGSMNGGSYTLEVKNVKDAALAGNVIDTVVVPFTGTDKVAPYIADADTAVTAPGLTAKRLSTTKVQINFSEAMDVATITNKLAYKTGGSGGIGGSPLASGDTVVATADGKGAIITFAAAPADFTVINVSSATLKDLAGNWITNYFDDVTIPALAKLTATAAMVNKNQVKLTIADIVSGMTADNFVVQSSVPGAAYTVNGIAVEYDATKTYITLYTSDIIVATTDTTGMASISVSTHTYSDALGHQYGTELTNVKNAYANTVQFGSVQLTDKMAPAIVSVVANGNDVSLKLETITVTFSEALYAPSVQDADFTVAGFTVSSIALSGGDKVVTLTLTQLANTNLATPAVTLVGPVEDAARNVLASNAAITATNP